MENKPFATRNIGQTAKGRKRSSAVRRKLGISSSDSEDGNEDGGRSAHSKSKSKTKRSRTSLLPDATASAASGRGDVHGAYNDLVANSMEHAIPMLPGADLLFKVQKRKSLALPSNGGAGINNISLENLQDFKRNLIKRDPLFAYRRSLVLEHVSDCQYLLQNILFGRNVLFHGIGDKTEFLNQFKHSLSGEDMLEIDGRETPQNPQNPHDSSSVPGPPSQVGGSSSSSSSSSAWASSHDNNPDQIVKKLLQKINVLLGFKEKLVSANLITDVVETAKFLSESLEHHYAPATSSVRYDTSDDRSILKNMLDMNRAQALLLPNSSSSTSSSSSSTVSANNTNADVVAKADSFKIKKEKAIRMHAEANKIDTTSRMTALSAPASKYANAVSRLYIVVRGLDGPGLSSPRSQEALSVLAACPSISLIASCDNVNCPLLWTSEIGSQFNWLYVNVSSYQLHVKTFAGSSVEKFVNRDGSSSTSSYHNSLMFYKGLTARQKDVINELIQAAQKNKQATLSFNGTSAKGKRKTFLCGMLKSELLAKCKAKLVTQSSVELGKTLKELTEQAMVHVAPHKSDDSSDLRVGEEFVTVNMTFDEMDQFLKNAAAK